MGGFMERLGDEASPGRSRRQWYSPGRVEAVLDGSWLVPSREDGPAVEFDDGTKLWMTDGVLHRTDGPAVEHPDAMEWHVYGLFAGAAWIDRDAGDNRVQLKPSRLLLGSLPDGSKWVRSESVPRRHVGVIALGEDAS